MSNLKTERISLRLFNINDLDNLHQIMTNEEIAHLAGFKRKETLSQTKVILDCFLKEPINALWAIEYNETKEMIGWIELHSPSEDIYDNSKEIGFVLSKEYWGKGLMVETITCLINYAFNYLNISKIICSHFKDNSRSKRVIEKCTFNYSHSLDNKLFYLITNLN